MSIEERHQKVDLPCDSSPPNKIALEDNYKYFWIFFFFLAAYFFEVALLSGDIFSLYKHYNVIFILDLFVARARGDCGNFPSRLPLLSSLYRRNNVTTFIKAMSKSYIQKGPIFMTVSVSKYQLQSVNTFKKDVFLLADIQHLVIAVLWIQTHPVTTWSQDKLWKKLRE